MRWIQGLAPMRFAKAALAALWVAGIAHANTVHVVGTGGFATFGGAYSVAQDGDVILVKAAAQTFNFGTLALGNKSLTIVGEPDANGAIPRFDGLAIENLAASKRVTVKGFALNGIFTMQGTFFIVQNNAGIVVIEDVHVAMPFGPGVSRVSNCANVTLTRCSFSGTDAFFGQGLPAIQLTNSNAFIYSGTYVGGDGSTAQAGGAGILVQGGFTYLHGVLAGGGNGGAGGGTGAMCANGGDGVMLQTLDPKVVSFGCLFIGGFPGFCQTTGSAGLPVSVQSGTYGAYSDTARSISATSPVRAGQATTLTIKGQPNEAVFLFVSPLVNPVFVPALKGTLLPLSPFTFLPIGNMPPSGPLVFPTTIPSGILPPGVSALDVYVQTHVAGAMGTGIVGAPTVITILDAQL